MLDSIFDSKLKQPLKERVVRLRLMVWEQKQRKKKSEETKSPSPETESIYAVSTVLLTTVIRRPQGWLRAT